MASGNVMGVRIKEVRKKRKMTQADVAEALGISRSVVACWETGVSEPNAEELRKLRDLFNVSSDYLCGFVDEHTTYNIPESYDIDFNRLNSLGKNVMCVIFDALAECRLFKNERY